MKIQAYFGGADTTYDGNGEYLTKQNKWSGAERAENRMSVNGAVSGGHRKRWSVSGEGGCGAGTERRAGF